MSFLRRQISVEEMLALWDFLATEVALVSDFAQASAPLVAGWHNQTLLGFLGVAVLAPEIGYVWGYSTAEVKCKTIFALHCRRLMREITGRYKVIHGNCSTANLRWNQLCFGAASTNHIRGGLESFTIEASRC